MNNHNKKTQKDSLAALRFETLGFSMMPMGMKSVAIRILVLMMLQMIWTAMQSVVMSIAVI